MLSTAKIPATASAKHARRTTINETELGELGVDIVLDHDLQPERGVIEGRDQQQHQQNRRQRTADPIPHTVDIGADEPNNGDHEP